MSRARRPLYSRAAETVVAYPMKIIPCAVAVITIFALQHVSAAPKQPREVAPQKPLTFANAISFFRDALRRPPIKVDQRTAIFAEGEWKNANVYNHSAIIVENADDDVEITCVMSGDEGMNWVNEFFDSHFFDQRETESLFALLNRGPGTHKANVGRFRVELSHWEPRHHVIVVLSLRPRRR